MVEAVRPEPEEVDLEQSIADALDSLPPDLREFMSNVAIVVEEEPPYGMPFRPGCCRNLGRAHETFGSTFAHLT